MYGGAEKKIPSRVEQKFQASGESKNMQEFEVEHVLLIKRERGKA